MKRYIKPNTELHSIELTQMIAESGNTFTNGTPTKINVGSAGFATSDGGGDPRALGKESNISSNSLWDEEE